MKVQAISNNYQQKKPNKALKIVEEVKDDMSIKGRTLADIYPRVSSWKQQLLEDYFRGRYGIID